MEIIPGLPNDLAIECIIRIPFEQICKAASVSKKWNNEIKLPEFRRRRKNSGLTRPVIATVQAMAGLNGSVYRVAIFDPTRGRWYDLPPVPEMVEGLPAFCRVVGVGSDLVVMGGCDPVSWRVVNSVFVYNFLSATWQRGADIPGEQRSFFGCAASEEDGTVVVTGGHDGDKNALKSALVYDVARDTWARLPDMAGGRDECTCVFHGGKFHVIGGYDGDTQGQFKPTAETLNFVARRWDQNDKITPATDDDVSPTGAYVEVGGTLYTTRDSEVVELRDAKWEVIARVPREVSSVACVTGWQGSKLMVFGNYKYGEGPNSGYVLELKSKIWTKIDIPSEYCAYVQSTYCLEL